MNEKENNLDLCSFGNSHCINFCRLRHGLFGIGGNNVKTHQFNYLDTFYFNVSDDLTNKTGVNGISIYDGVSYNYPNSDSVFRFMC